MSNTDLIKLPQATDVEALVLGAVILESDAGKMYGDDVSPDLFYNNKNKLVAEAIGHLINVGEPIDLATICNRLKSKGQLKEAGGPSYVVELTNRVASSTNIEAHIAILKQKMIARKLIQMSLNLIQGLQGEDDPLEALSDTAKHVTDFMMITAGGVSSTLSETITEIVKDIEKSKEEKGVTGVPIPLNTLNKRMGGWQDGNLIILAARPAMGKLQPLTEPILTPSGWELMGDIKKGSKVLCPIKGVPIEVIGTYPQNNLDIYRVNFSDGTHTECCNDHLWKVQEPVGGSGKRPWKVVDTQYMINKGVVDSRNKSRFRIPLTTPVQFNEKPVALHPYVLGLLIGNGYMASNNTVTLTFSEDDVQEIYEKIANKIPSDVSICIGKKYGESKAIKISFSSSIKKYLLDLRLIDCKSEYKFIPNGYLYNSKSIRKEILSGLMDSDGSCFIPKGRNSKQCSYSTVSKILKDDIIELIRSLGGVASYSEDKRERYNNGVCYNIPLRTPHNPFGLERKKQTFNRFDYKQTFTKTIRSIEFLRKDKGQCILVDSDDHLYITRDYTVTHNTGLALQFASHPVFHYDKKVMFFSMEMTIKELVARILAQELQEPANRFTRDAKHMNTDVLHKKLGQYGYVYNNNLVIDDECSTINKLIARCKKQKMKHGLDMVVVDYLQLLSDPSVRGNREQEISSISRKLKRMGKELQIPVIALSQLSRSVENRGGGNVPMLSDLRESGSLEQDADVVMFLYRPEYYGFEEDEEGKSTEGLAQIMTKKFRSGGVGDDVAKFTKEFVKFKDLDEFAEPNTPHYTQLEPNDNFDEA